MNKGDIVTTQLENEFTSNTFLVEAVLEESNVLVTHPLSPGVFLIKKVSELNQVAPTVRCSLERALNFISKNKEMLDYNGAKDLESLCICFVVNRELTPKQKKVAADLSGKVANVKFSGNIKRAMNYIVEHEAVLDDFNRMWYNNFSKLFKGKQEISSSKQSGAIFNMAGFILGEFDPNNVV